MENVVVKHRACPFCGGSPLAWISTRGMSCRGSMSRAVVECHACGIGTFVWGDSDESALAGAWRKWDDRRGGSDEYVEPVVDDEDDEWLEDGADDEEEVQNMDDARGRLTDDYLFDDDNVCYDDFQEW